MVIHVLDIVKACNTAAQGAEVASAVRRALENGQSVTLSFEGVNETPSSFINSSIVDLVYNDPPEALRERLLISNITDQIATMITRCLRNGRNASTAVA
ncbi:STAS-like domain-containing protein [Tsuneonella dongtanensis]|uniref:STAS-like domain-containing protein n=1 Tax=Tsuneonella dongtanensis TaxID=692370 RepID=UPI0009443B8C